MSTKLLLTPIVCGLLALVAQPKPLSAAKPSLAGSWTLRFVQSTPTPTPPVTEFPGLATFTADGSLVETDGSELAPHPSATVTGSAAFGSPGHGIWQLTPSMTGFYIQYLSFSVNANGTVNSTSITTATVSMTTSTSGGTTISGDYTTTTTSGTITKVSSGTLTGQLIPHPALP